MNDIAIFGGVMSKAELDKWVNDLVEDGVRSGEIAPDEAKEKRAKFMQSYRGVIPMHVCIDEHADKPLTAERFALPEWNGKYTEHRWLVDPDMAFNLTFSHVVLFEGPHKKPDASPFYFDGKVIQSQFGICLFDDKTNSYLRIHCSTCAMTIVDWITTKQDKWMKAQGDDTAPKQSTHDAPSKLQ